MSSPAFWKQTAVALTLPGLAVPALADQPPRQEVQGDDPEVSAPVVEGQQIGYTMDDILSAQAARARFGFEGDAAYVESLLKDLEQGDAVFGVGGVFTRDEIVIVQRQLGYEDAANALHEYLSTDNLFGGLWIDHRNGGHITVAYVNPSERLNREVRRQLGDAPFSIMEVDNSQDKLIVYLGILASVARAKEVRVDLEVLVKTNSIAVTGDAVGLERFNEEVLPAPEALPPFGAPIRLDRQVGETSVKEALLRGGQLIGTKPGSVCSLGPTVYDDRTRERYVVTAGHCDRTGDGTHFIGDTKVGHTKESAERGTVDAALIAVARGSYATDDILWYDEDGSVGGTKDVVGSHVQYVTGGTLCQSQGMSKRIRCGGVVSTNAVNYNSTAIILDEDANRIVDLYKVNMCSRPGDSGSPAFYHQPGQDYVSIAGIHMAGAANQAKCTSSDHAWIVKLNNIKSEFKVDLLTDD